MITTVLQPLRKEKPVPGPKPPAPTPFPGRHQDSRHERHPARRDGLPPDPAASRFLTSR